jgi:hypothetical protein
MVLPWKADRACSNLLFSSSSSSSSVQSVRGFLAPPESTFFVTIRQIVSSSRLRADEPGAESQYCLTSTAAMPPVPPKYWKIRSITSAVCGMLEPPLEAERRNRSTPASSIALSVSSRLRAARSLLSFRCLARQWRHSAVKISRSFRQRKCCLSSGKVLPQTLHVRSSMTG